MSVNLDLLLKPQLKQFLIDRGMSVSDYSVHQLRELAKKAVDLELPVLRTPDDTKEFLRQRSRVIIDGKIIEFPTVSSQDLNKWSDDLKLIPIFTQADVFVYLLSKANAEWSPARLQNYKSERGYRLYKSNHIQSVHCHELAHNHLYVRSQCVRETSQSADPYRTWCLLNCTDGSCASAGCDCTGLVMLSINVHKIL